MFRFARVVAFLLALAVPSIASAGGINLTWAQCGGNSNAIAACNSNTATPLLMVASYVPPATFTDSLMAVEAIIDLRIDGISVPGWWQFFNPGSCRANSLSLVMADPQGENSNCLDGWGGRATGAIASYQVQDGGRARIHLSGGVPREWAFPVDSETEYWAFGLSIDFANTTGPGSCAGCLNPACILLTQLTMVPTPGHPSVTLLNPASINFVTFQGGGSPGQYLCHVPTKNRTWGSIKSMYR